MNKEAILTAIQAVPKRPYQLIAQEHGVSVASVSGVATEAGIKRGRGGAGTSASPRGRRSEASEQIAAMRLEAVPMAEIMAQTGYTRQGVDAACLSFLRRQVQAQAQVQAHEQCMQAYAFAFADQSEVDALLELGLAGMGQAEAERMVQRQRQQRAVGQGPERDTGWQHALDQREEARGER